MLLVFRPFQHPFSQHCLLRRFQCLVRIRRRHHNVHVKCGDATNQFTHFRIARDNGRLSTFSWRRDTVRQIQTESALQRRRIRAVTGKALSRQNRAHVAIEVDLITESRCRKQLHCQDKFHLKINAMLHENSLEFELCPQADRHSINDLDVWRASKICHAGWY